MKYCLLLVLFLSLSVASPVRAGNSKRNRLTVHDTIRLADSSALQKSELEMRRQIADIKSTVADTKESFYNTSIYLWSFIVGAFGVILVIVGFIGFRSVGTRVDEIRDNALNNQNNTQQLIRDIKSELDKKLDDLKGEFTEYKKEFTHRADRFEDQANSRIEKGLTSDMQLAVKSVMEGSFGKEIKTMSEQLGDLQTQVNGLESLRPLAEDLPINTNAPATPGKNAANINPSNNAFDAN